MQGFLKLVTCLRTSQALAGTNVYYGFSWNGASKDAKDIVAGASVFFCLIMHSPAGISSKCSFHHVGEEDAEAKEEKTKADGFETLLVGAPSGGLARSRAQWPFTPHLAHWVTCFNF